MQLFRNMLWVVDGRAYDRTDLDWIIRLAKENDAALTVVDVVRSFGWLRRVQNVDGSAFRQLLTEQKQQELGALAEQIRRAGVSANTAVLQGEASTEIIRQGLRSECDLVIKAAKGENWFKGFVGTTGLQLVKKSPSAVLITKPQMPWTIARVMAAVNSGKNDELHEHLNRRILNVAAGLSGWMDWRLDVVHSWELFGESALRQHLLKDEFQQLASEHQRAAESNFAELLNNNGMAYPSDRAKLLHGDPCWVLPQYASREKIDLIVIGTVGRRGFAGSLMGNTAETVLGKVRCSILALKPKGFISPVTLGD